MAFRKGCGKENLYIKFIGPMAGELVARSDFLATEFYVCAVGLLPCGVGRKMIFFGVETVHAWLLKRMDNIVEKQPHS